MRGLAFVFASSCILATGAAQAEPSRQSETVRVSLAGRAQRATALRWVGGGGGGWQLEVATDRTRAELIDVTPGTPARTLSVPVVGGALSLDAVRFAGGHVYRAQLAGAEGGAGGAPLSVSRSDDGQAAGEEGGRGSACASTATTRRRPTPTADDGITPRR